jgi:hypothetical protein
MMTRNKHDEWTLGAVGALWVEMDAERSLADGPIKNLAQRRE